MDNAIDLYKDYKPDHDGCSKVTFQNAEVSVPVEVKPTAKVGKIEAICCGDPVVTRKDKYGNCCEFIISQKIAIKIPIKYDVMTKVGENIVNCKADCCK